MGLSSRARVACILAMAAGSAPYVCMELMHACKPARCTAAISEGSVFANATLLAGRPGAAGLGAGAAASGAALRARRMVAALLGAGAGLRSAPGAGGAAQHGRPQRAVECFSVGDTASRCPRPRKLRHRQSAQRCAAARRCCRPKLPRGCASSSSSCDAIPRFPLSDSTWSQPTQRTGEK